MNRFAPTTIREGDSKVLDFTASALPQETLAITLALQSISQVANEARESLGEALADFSTQIDDLAAITSEKISKIDISLFEALAAALSPIVPLANDVDGFRFPWVARCKGCLRLVALPDRGSSSIPTCNACT